MRIKDVLKNRKVEGVMVVFGAMIIFTLFFHVNVSAHTSHHGKDMHPVHHTSSVCSANHCCIQVNQNSFSLKSSDSSFNTLNLPLFPHLNENSELPYKPPKY